MANRTSQYEDIMQREDLFWLRILGDHAFFIMVSLQDSEIKLKQQSKHFKDVFDNFLAQAQLSNTTSITKFHETVYKWVDTFKKFKLYLLDLMLKREVKIDLVPTFINHMVNELEEYESILLSYINKKRLPNFTTVDHHLLWLLDASGHSSAIASSLDDTEFQLIDQALEFKTSFQKLYIKSVEYKGFLRTNQHIPSIGSLDAEGSHQIVQFSQFMTKLTNLLRQNLALADLSVYLLDHMLREECYYLQHINELNPALELSFCDFTRERETK